MKSTGASRARLNLAGCTATLRLRPCLKRWVALGRLLRNIDSVAATTRFRPAWVRLRATAHWCTPAGVAWRSDSDSQHMTRGWAVSHTRLFGNPLLLPNTGARQKRPWPGSTPRSFGSSENLSDFFEDFPSLMRVKGLP